MEVLVVVLAVVAVVAIAAAAWFFYQKRRTEQLQQGFGPEYERTVREVGNRGRAEKQLTARRERVEALHIHPLTADESERFAEGWRSTQARFVDDPGAAIRAADGLIGAVMQARGYPVGDFEQRAADISVDHAAVVTNYRAAHRIALAQERGEATTEDLRQALVHYRALFDELLDADGTVPAARDQRQEARR